MQSASLSSVMPIRFNALVIETTNRCNAKCGMCYQSSGPKGHDDWGMHSLDTSRLVQVIKDAVHIPNIDSRLHIAGGEAFLREEDVYTLVETGQKVGFREITLTTNAFWGSTDSRAEKICKLLSLKGVTVLEISWDHWHLDYIKPECVTRVLKAARRFNISTNLRILTTKSHSVQEALGFLRNGWKYASLITHGPVFRSGRAISEITQDDFYRKGVQDDENCNALLNLAINSTGDVFPCCAGIDQTKQLGLGNVNQDNIVTIAKNMSENLWIKKLVFGGIVPLEKMVASRRTTPLSIDPNDSMCSRCWSLFSDKENVEIVKQYAEEIKSSILLQIEARAGRKLAYDANTRSI